MSKLSISSNRLKLRWLDECIDRRFAREFADHKIKKASGVNSIQLKPTVDILAEMGKAKKKKQLLVGFALETNDALKNGMDKLKGKNLDLIVVNSLEDAGAGFASDTNKIIII